MLLFFIINVESKMITSVVIQGSMPVDGDWIDDSENPLPYKPSVANMSGENEMRLMLTSAPDGINFMFSAISPGEKYHSFACEI